jgi:signal transduction histidine kinase
MDPARENIADLRERTDASLGAERATTDVATDRTTAMVQRALDDLIERDRMLADERLLKFRESADTLLARERSASPERPSSVALERHMADEGRKAEREGTDALLERERERADVGVETERRDLEGDRARLEARRQDTDQDLSTERKGTDVGVNAVGARDVALAHAQKQEARRADVLAMVAHDLRSPLCAIALNAKRIAESTREPSTREAAEDMTRGAARMERLLRDLLEVVRIESGTLRLVKRRHDVGALVAEVLQSYRPLFADRGITFSVEGPPAAVIASFDYDRLVQVLSNLLGNAMKFTPHEGTVRLQVERRAGEVELVVRDSGPGIHPDALPHVFERFWQIDDDAHRGLGLGLYICERIVQAHGGRIWAESDFGKGATFRFTLPAS